MAEVRRRSVQGREHNRFNKGSVGNSPDSPINPASPDSAARPVSRVREDKVATHKADNRQVVNKPEHSRGMDKAAANSVKAVRKVAIGATSTVET